MTTKIFMVLLAFGVCSVALSGCKGGLPGTQPDTTKSSPCAPGTQLDPTTKQCVPTPK